MLNKPELIVSLINSDNDPIISDQISVAVPYGKAKWGKNSDEKWRQASEFLIFPLLSKDTGIWTVNGYFTLKPGTSSITYDFAFNVTPDEIKQMKNVKLEIRKGNPE